MAEYIKVANIEDVPPGRVVVVNAGSKRLALCNVDGAFWALDDVCTHDGGPLGEGELIDGEIECPRHGARFDVATGAVRSLPAVMPVKAYPVKVEGSEVKVAIS